MDIRITEGNQNAPDGITAASVKRFTRSNPVAVVLVNASGDVYNALSSQAGSGGDGAILDGADTGVRATVKDYANSNPLAVVLTNVSGDVYNALGAASGGDGALLDGSDNGIRATVKDYGNSNPLTVVLVNVSGDAYNASSGGSGGDGAINDGANSAIKATVLTEPTARPTAADNPLLVQMADDLTRELGKIQSPIGVQILGGSMGAQVSASGDFDIRDLTLNDKVTIGAVTVPIGVTGDVSTTPKAGSTWPISSGSDLNVREQSKIGVHVDSGRVGVTGDVSTTPKAGSTWPISADSGLNVREQAKIGVHVDSGRVSVTGDILLRSNTGTDIGDVGIKSSEEIGVRQLGAWNGATSGDQRLVDGVDNTIKATVRDYSGSNPVAVVLTNSTGDTYNAGTKRPILTTTAGITASGEGSLTLVGAVAGRKIKVTRVELQGVDNTGRVHFASGASGSQLSVQWDLNSREGVVEYVSPVDDGYLFSTAAGSLLSLERGSAKPVKYAISYHTEDAI